jgi:hypothetical protein
VQDGIVSGRYSPLPPITGADTIHALPSTHLIDDDISALLEPFADASGIIEGDGRIVPCGSSNGRDGKVVSVDEDRISISANEVVQHVPEA